MKILGIITARAHSSRLFKKNLLKIKNKSLVEITLDFSKTISKLSDIIITTNSKEIISIAKSKKIKNVENRPFGLSSITASSALTVIHAIKWYELNHYKVDAICLLQPTSPFRDLKFVNKCIDIFIKNRKTVISTNPLCEKISQNLSDGSVYIIKKNDLFRLRSFNEKFSIKVPSISKRNSLDIDNLKDLQIADKLSKISI